MNPGDRAGSDAIAGIVHILVKRIVELQETLDFYEMNLSVPSSPGPAAGDCAATENTPSIPVAKSGVDFNWREVYMDVGDELLYLDDSFALAANVYEQRWPERVFNGLRLVVCEGMKNEVLNICRGEECLGTLDGWELREFLFWALQRIWRWERRS